MGSLPSGDDPVGAGGVCLASTVRDILLRPRPGTSTPTPAQANASRPLRPIAPRYPNHVWSVDRTRVFRWGLRPTWVLVAIDHFSRTAVVVTPLEGPNAGWVVEALEAAFLRHGPPRHLISDHEGVFLGEAFAELLGQWHVQHRLGAVGRHGSIAVTERLILTLKQEWLRRVPILRGLEHLRQLLDSFAEYYNEWRGHSTLEGAVPAATYREEPWQRPDPAAKEAPRGIARRTFPEVRVTAYRLAA